MRPLWQTGAMSSSVSSFAITPHTTIGELVAARPQLSRLFEQLDIDYCCGGHQTLETACARQHFDLDTTIALLESATAALAATPVDADASAMSLTQLANHIESTHHAYLKTELPRLIEMAERVAIKHSHRDRRLPEVSSTVSALAGEMLDHMQKEETVLFPLIRQLEAGTLPPAVRSHLTAPIARMESEHESAGGLTALLRSLTDDFTPDAEACNTHRALLAGLAEFRTDLHRHVHKENNVLFPRALALAATQA